MTMFNTRLPVNLIPVFKEQFGTMYAQLPDTYKKVFKMKTSDRPFEEIHEIIGFGPAQVKDQGGLSARDVLTQGHTTRATHVAYALSYSLTKEAMDDKQVIDMVSMASREMAKSFNLTKNINAANILNRAFTSSYSFGDGKELIATDHPTMDGTQSNELTASDIDEDSLEEAVQAIWDLTDSRGNKISAEPDKLVIHHSEIMNVHRILQSAKRVGVADNDANALKDLALIKDVVPMRYLTDEDAWFVTTTCDNGLQILQRSPVEFFEDRAISTLNKEFVGYERYALTVGDWRCIVGALGV